MPGLQYRQKPIPACVLAILLSAPVTAAAHTGMQSVFVPMGEQAARIHEISMVLFIGGALIFVVVMLLLLLAVFGPLPLRILVGRRSVIIGGGIVFPAVVLAILFVYTLAAGSTTDSGHAPAARIEVTGELWWWRVRYLDDRNRVIAETANEIRIPAGQTVEFLLKSDNVLHSFWVPSLAGKLDMIPGHLNAYRTRVDVPGAYRGQCAEYCGAQHANMAFHVIAERAQDFSAWLRRQSEPARIPAEPFLQHGQRLFQENRCGQCHAIRGTSASGSLGPDLTHVGSRLSLAAGTLPGGKGALAGWIVDNQHIKPGNRMPAYKQFSGEDLRALAAYLESLQ